MHRTRPFRFLPLSFSLVAVAGLLLSSSIAFAQGPMGRGQMKDDPAHMQDMTVIHGLLDHGAAVRRTVTLRPDGVETLTESDDPAIAKDIQKHVGSMYTRLKTQQPIHMRDPLFRAVFEHASQINLAHEVTPKGLKVTETSTDPYVVSLIQKHAEVVSAFIKNGRSEAMTNHEVPAHER